MLVEVGFAFCSGRVKGASKMIREEKKKEERCFSLVWKSIGVFFIIIPFFV